MTFAKPAIIQNKPFRTKLSRTAGNILKSVQIMVKINSFPAIIMNGSEQPVLAMLA